MARRSITIFPCARKAATRSRSTPFARRCKAGFRVTTNTTVFEGVDSKSVRTFFTEMMDAGVEGMMISPGYSYDKAPDQQHFTGREGNQSMFRKILSNRDPRWRFNMSPLFLEFLMGKRNLHCTPWGMPAYSIFGWQKPCYLLQDGYTDTFQELLDSTDWSKYGYESGNREVRQLHAALRLRGVRGGLHVLVQRRVRHGSRHAVLAVSRSRRRCSQIAAEKPPASLVQIEAIAPRPTLKGTDVAARGPVGRRHRAGVRLPRRRHHHPARAANASKATSSIAMHMRPLPRCAS